MKIGNNNSTFLQKVAEIAADMSGPKETRSEFKDQILKITSKTEPALKDILAQFMDPKPMPGEMPKPMPGDMAQPMPGDMGEMDELEDPLTDSIMDDGGLDPGMEGIGGDDEAKRLMCEAIVALCGSPEEAHNCIDEYTAGGEEAPPDLEEDPMADPMADPMEDVGADVGAMPMENPSAMPMDGASPMPM